MINMLGEMEHGLTLFWSFQLKSLAITVEMMMQAEFFNKMILYN